MTPEERVRAAAARYDDTGSLAEQALAALARRVATSGKVCGQCRRALPLSAFGTDSRNTDGLHFRCRSCRSRPRPRDRV